ncbi:hypothetical protein NMG60_11007758 [Bertholletia excelsa]
MEKLVLWYLGVWIMAWVSMAIFHLAYNWRNPADNFLVSGELSYFVRFMKDGADIRCQPVGLASGLEFSQYAVQQEGKLVKVLYLVAGEFTGRGTQDIQVNGVL